jgi:hypothetical protein
MLVNLSKPQVEILLALVADRKVGDIPVSLLDSFVKVGVELREALQRYNRGDKPAVEAQAQEEPKAEKPKGRAKAKAAPGPTV